MKIQIEPKKETSMEKFTYISYEEYQTAIAKAPKDVRLSDVKDCIQEASADLEYYFMTKNNKGDVIEIEIINDDQPIPLLEGSIKVKTISKKTKVNFQIIDEAKMKLDSFLEFDSTIPISSKKPKTLEDVRKAIPDYMQNFLKNGKSVKYFFEEEKEDVGFVKKELFQDSVEVPLVTDDGRKTIQCWIMISSDLSEKFQLRRNRIEMPVICMILLMCFIINVGLFIKIFFIDETFVKEGKFKVGVPFILMPLSIIIFLLADFLIFGIMFLLFKKFEFKFLEKHLLK